MSAHTGSTIGSEPPFELGGRGAQVILRAMTGRMLDAEAARDAWPRILEHKWYLSERLGRDVGLRVAATDYLDNIERVHDGRVN